MRTDFHSYVLKRLKNMAESDGDGNLTFRGTAVEIIETINIIDDAEEHLRKLFQSYMTVEYYE